MLTEEELKKLPDNPNTAQGELGKDTLLSVDAGSGTPGKAEWVEVGGQRNSPVNREADTIDASHKTSGGWKVTKAGLKGWSIAYTGLVLRGTKGYEIMKALFDAGKEGHFKVAYPDGGWDEGWASITTFNGDFPHDGLATLSANLQGVGKLTEHAAGETEAAPSATGE